MTTPVRLVGDPKPQANTGVPEADALLEKGSMLRVGPVHHRIGTNPATGERIEAYSAAHDVDLTVLLPEGERIDANGFPATDRPTTFLERLIAGEQDQPGIFFEPLPAAGVVRVWRIGHDPAEVTLIARSLTELVARPVADDDPSMAEIREEAGNIYVVFAGPPPITFDPTSGEGRIAEAVIDGDTLVMPLPEPTPMPEPVATIPTPPPTAETPPEGATGALGLPLVLILAVVAVAVAVFLFR